MAKYRPIIAVHWASTGYAAIESPVYDTGSSTRPRYNAWRPTYADNTFKPGVYTPPNSVAQYGVRPFSRWVIVVNTNEYVTDEMYQAIVGTDKKTIEVKSQTFQFNNDVDYDADGQPKLDVYATVYFGASSDESSDESESEPEPWDPETQKLITVTAVNGSYGMDESHCGSVSVNGKSGVQTASDSKAVPKGEHTSASFTLDAQPVVGFRFDRWEDDGSASQTRVVTVTSDRTYTAFFKKMYVVDIVRCINARYYVQPNELTQKYHDPGDQIIITVSPYEGASVVRFIAVKVGSNGAVTSFWSEEGEDEGDTVKEFSMPEADVQVVIVCLYEAVRLEPRLHTDGVAKNGSGGSVDPSVAVDKKHGETVSFTATPAEGYKLGKSGTPPDDYAWDWVTIWNNDIFVTGGTKYGSQTSDVLKGDAVSQLENVPAWAQCDSIPDKDKWFFYSRYVGPLVYFCTDRSIHVPVTVQTSDYGDKVSWVITKNADYNTPGSQMTGTGDAYMVVDFSEGELKFDIGSGPWDGYGAITVELRASSGHFLCEAEVWKENPSDSYGMERYFRVHFKEFGTAYEKIVGDAGYNINVKKDTSLVVYAGAWPEPTHEILCSPDNGGVILCGDDGQPMAQYYHREDRL